MAADNEGIPLLLHLGAHLHQFRRLGAKIQVDGKIAIIEGVEKLTGAPMEACDLRAGAGMIIAGPSAPGRCAGWRCPRPAGYVPVRR